MKNLGLCKSKIGYYVIMKHDDNYQIHDMNKDIIRCKTEEEMKIQLKMLYQQSTEKLSIHYDRSFTKEKISELEKTIKVATHNRPIEDASER